MAKGDVTLKFDAETASFVQKILAAKDALAATADESRKAGNAVASSGDKMAVSFDGLTSKVLSFTGAFLGIGGVVSTAAAAWNSHLQEMQDKANSFTKSVATLEDTLASMGRLGDLSKWTDFLKGASKDLLPMQGGEGQPTAPGMFSQIVKQFGASATDDQLKSIFGGAMDAMKTGQSPEAATQFAGIFGNLLLNRPREGQMASMSTTQLEDIAGTLQKYMPQGVDDKGWRFINRSKDQIGAMNLLIAASRSKENSRAMEGLIQDAEHPLDAKDIHGEIKKLELEQKKKPREFAGRERLEELHRQLRLAEIAPGDRVQAMLDDPTLAKPEYQRPIENLRQRTDEYIERGMNMDTMTRRIAERSRQVESDPNLAAREKKRIAEISTANAAAGTPADATDQAVWEQFEADLRKRGNSKFTAATVTGIEKLVRWTGFDKLHGGEESIYDSTKRELNRKAAEESALRREEAWEREHGIKGPISYMPGYGPDAFRIGGGPNDQHASDVKSLLQRIVDNTDPNNRGQKLPANRAEVLLENNNPGQQ